MQTRSRTLSSSRSRAAIGVLAAGLTIAGAPQLAWAQDDDLLAGDRGWEAGGRYWWSQGKTQWNHNARPTFGNPGSILVYDRLNAHSLEFHGAKRWAQGWFITGNAGGGLIYKGNLNDSDYNSRQVKFSETNSSISEGVLGYVTVDGGYNVWRFSGGSTIGFFGGVQYWVEEVEAYGTSNVIPPRDPFTGVPLDARNTDRGVKVITNQVRWTSFRTGVALRSQLGQKLRLTATLAAVPYTMMENDDSHHLRSGRVGIGNNLGPTPNITMEGSGYGYQLDAEVRYAVYKSLDLGLGARYWRLKADGDVRFAGRTTLPLNELESTRYGLTFSSIYRW